jgi:hypothetical protein
LVENDSIAEQALPIEHRAGIVQVPVVANRRLVRAASFSWARRCCSGSTISPGAGRGRPTSFGTGGPSRGISGGGPV